MILLDRVATAILFILLFIFSLPFLALSAVYDFFHEPTEEELKARWKRGQQI